MYDKISINRHGSVHQARRYLRDEAGHIYQSLFYFGLVRSDPTGYAQFAGDDPVMNAAAHEMLTEMVDEITRKNGARHDWSILT